MAMKRLSLLIISVVAIGSAAVLAQPSVALPDSLSSMRRIEALAPVTEPTEQESADNEAVPTMDRTQAEAIWEEANQLYIDGKTEEALESYLKLVEAKFVSAKLFYNVANAYYRCGDIGDAVLYYNRALRLAPSWADIHHNLEIAQRQCKDNISAVPEIWLSRTVRAVRDLLSCGQWTIISIIVFAVLLVAALMFFVGQRRGIRRAGFYAAAVAFVLFVATTLFAASARSAELSHDEAIVIGRAISVKSSPDKAATDVFVLHEGTKVTVETEIDGWCEITIANGNKGWTLASNIERI